MAENAIVLRPGNLTLAELRRIARSDVEITIDPGCRGNVEAAAKTVDDIVREGRTVYGVNTGFGLLAHARIEPSALANLQRNLVLSHSAGTGPNLDDDTVRLTIALKVAALAQGHSGVRWLVIEALLALIKHRVYPCVPAKGSVGASGDLAPLAHLSAALLGVGEVRHKGKTLPAVEGLRIAGLTPLELGPKEGLALLNGTQVSTALALMGLFMGEDVFAGAVVAGALSVDAAKGSDTPFDARIHAVRGQPGQELVAKVYARLLADSPIRESHRGCEKVQDPYSLRCQPQVMGAVLDHMRFASSVIAREANAVSDNPLVFPDDGDVLSGGNFHAEPVAITADLLAIALTEIGTLSERRTALLVDPAMSGLPAFLVKDGGLNSGFMIAQVTAAALASENNTLAHPASVDSIPTSANQEDHVSMATFAARRVSEIGENVAGIVAIELLAAAQGIEFHKPLQSSPPLHEVITTIRTRAANWDSDRFFAPDIAALKELVHAGTFNTYMPELLPSLSA